MRTLFTVELVTTAVFCPVHRSHSDVWIKNGLEYIVVQSEL